MNINKENSVMEPYGDMVEQALLNLHSEVVNLDRFGQQENDDVQEELADRNNLLDDVESNSDEGVFLDEMSRLNTKSDYELNAMIRLLDQKQRALLIFFHSWEKPFVKSRSGTSPLNLGHLQIFLTDNAGYKKLILM